jgi:hypothetical protein
VSVIKEFIATDQAIAQKLSDCKYVMICIEDSVGNIDNGNLQCTFND